MCLRSIWIRTVLVFERCDTTLCFDPSPLCHTLSLFWSNSLSYKRVTYFFNGPLVFCIMILFDFLSFEVPKLRDEICVGIDFRKFFFCILCGNKFSLYGMYQRFRGFNFRGHDIYKDFVGINFAVALRNNFFHDPRGFKTLILFCLKEIINGHEKAKLKKHCIRGYSNFRSSISEKILRRLIFAIQQSRGQKRN